VGVEWPPVAKAKKARQDEAEQHPLAPGSIAPPVGGGDLELDRRSLVEPLGRVVVDRRRLVACGIRRAR
jgi:hypothetical protein